MSQAIQQFLESLFSHEAVVFVLSLIPVSEIRGGLIAARLYDMNLFLAFLIGYIGNMLPIPFLLLFLKAIFRWMRRVPFLSRLVDWLDRKAAKHKETITKYAWFGLFLLVAIPLPGTGAWTGAVIASILEIRLKTAVPMILLGLLIAGVIVTSITYGASMVL